MKQLYVLVWVLCFNAFVHSEIDVRAGIDEKDRSFIQLHNLLESQKVDRSAVTVSRPVAEYEPAKYFLMNGEYRFGSENVKKTILKNLPKDVTAVVIVDDADEVVSTEQSLRSYIDSSRLKVVDIDPGFANSFWSRDSLPIPVFISGSTPNKLGFVDAKYYHNYEPDLEISKLFKVDLIKHNYFFEGGNFAADTKGTCFAENKGTYIDNMLKTYYGCKKNIIMPESGGIGHFDERAKLLSDNVMVTDNDEYRKVFEKEGYKVYMLPHLTGYRSYSNSLLVNGTLFVPTFGVKEDATALDVYKKLGFNTVELDSAKLASGHGSVHCITMTYPDAGL